MDLQILAGRSSLIIRIKETSLNYLFMRSDNHCWLFSNLCACLLVLVAEYTNFEKYDSQLIILEAAQLI
jgi:hypothetical protein